MNLKKLRKMYKENPILKEAFEDTFSSDELGLTENNTSSKTNTILSQDEFNKAFNKILKGSTQRYLDIDINTSKISKKKTTRIEVLDKRGNWLLDYDTNKKKAHFWFREDKFYDVLRDKFSLQYDEFQSCMKSLVETQYKMIDTKPNTFF